MISALLALLVCAQSPTTIDDARKEAASSYLAGDFENATRVLSPYLGGKTLLIGDKLLLAHAFRAQGDRRAQELYAEVLSVDDSNPDAHLGYFFMALDEGDTSRALEHLAYLKGELRVMGQEMLDGVNQTRAAISLGAALTGEGVLSQDLEAQLSVAAFARTRLELSAIWNPVGATVVAGAQTRVHKNASIRAGVGASYLGDIAMARAQVGVSWRIFRNTTFTFNEAFDLALSSNIDLRTIEQDGAARSLTTLVIEQNIHPSFSFSAVAMLSTFLLSPKEASFTLGAHFALPFNAQSTLLVGTSYVNGFALNARASIDVPVADLIKLGVYASTNSYFASAGAALKYGF